MIDAIKIQMFLFLESQLSYLEQKHLLASKLLNIEFFKRLCTIEKFVRNIAKFV